MTAPIPINLAFEDALTESLALKILRTIPTEYSTKTVYNRGGFGYLKRTINGFNNAAKGTPFLIGTDLDRYECPTALIDDWLTQPKHHNLLIRVAVKEAEAWVLADRDNFAKFLGISIVRIPVDVEALPNPKEALIQLHARPGRNNCATIFVRLPTAPVRSGPTITRGWVALSSKVGIRIWRDCTLEASTER